MGFATLCFALALMGVIAYAQDLTGFYYHPRILALTHLITLGWITGNILGLLYIICPMALRTSLPSSRYDAVAFILYTIGVMGMVTHFWQDLPAGMIWSAGCVYAAIIFAGIRVMARIAKGKIPGFVKLHIFFSFTNMFVAGGWGFVIGLNKVYGFLPTSSSPNVIAHAHLAAIGWAGMMVFGASYRLLPMFVPGAPVKGITPWISGILLECGVIGLFFALLFQSPFAMIFAFLILAGTILFLKSAVHTLRTRKAAPPPEPPGPDFSMLHAPFSLLSLLLCLICGPILLQLPPTEQTLQLALGYGAIGFIGFLSQMIVGFKPKILSIFTWYHAFSRYGTQVPRPVDMPVRVFQIAIFALWLTGLPLLISGIVAAARMLIMAGGVFILSALVLSTIHEASILRLIWKSGTTKQP